MTFAKFLTAGASAVITCFLAATASAQSDDLASKFGAIDYVRHASLSPDGQHLAFITPNNPGAAVAVIDFDKVGANPRILTAITNPKERLLGCLWPTNTRLLCRVAVSQPTVNGIVGFTRMFALNTDGSGAQMISAPTSRRAMGLMQDGGRLLDWNVPENPGAVLMTRQYVPEDPSSTLLAKDLKGLGVEAVDTLTLKRVKVEHPRVDAYSYLSDGQGHVRIMGLKNENSRGYTDSKLEYRYRRKDSKAWEVLGTLDTLATKGTGFEPVAVDPKSDRVFGFEEKNGFRTLYAIALDGSMKREMILGRDDVDIDELITIGRSARVVGASYATEKRSAQYFDPELVKLAAGLGKALPGSPSISFADASQDEARLLVIASGDTNPGMVYLLEKAGNRLSEVMPVRPELEGLTLSPMKPVTYQAADGTAIPAYLTLPAGGPAKGLPTIVMPHGGPSARDEWGFDWLVQFFAARGYAVLQPNYRGSSGYGADWYAHNGFQSWKTAVGDVNDAGRWLVKQGIAAPGRMAIMGWSYGGYAALQSQVLDPNLYKAVVAVAPVTDLGELKREAEFFSNFENVSQFVGSGPHVADGSPARHAEAFRAPVLLFHGDLDANVGVGESRLMKGRLASAGKNVTYVEFPGLDHSLDDATARTRLLRESDAFFRKAFGMP